MTVTMDSSETVGAAIAGESSSICYPRRVRTATASLPRGHEAPAGERPASLQPGMRLGAYELLTPLASGGMGHVWSAVRIGDFGFRRTAAIKVMREELAREPGFRRMFLDEARLASRISHTNVVEVLDLGEAEGGTLFQAMALVEGDSLARLERTARERATTVEPCVVARITSDVLRGLHAAHELRSEEGQLVEFVHRDVSPQNILVGLDGVAKITDFGVAKAAGANATTSRSGPKGKVAYMAPEQFLGEHVDRRCDVFAVGVVLWELLTALRMPTDPASIAAGTAIPHPCEVVADAHRPLADVAMRALAHEREERFATAEEMADAIEREAHAAGLVLSSKSVAAWVAELAGDHIKQQRDGTEAQLARTHVGTAWAEGAGTTKVDPRTLGRQRRSPYATVGALLVAVAVIVYAGRAVMRSRGAQPPVETTATALATRPAAADPPPSEASAAALPRKTASAIPEETSPAPGASAPRPRGRGTARPQRPPASASATSVSAAPKPKYGNPYEAPTP
jgi:serine/threonine protein kinase